MKNRLNEELLLKTTSVQFIDILETTNNYWIAIVENITDNPKLNQRACNITLKYDTRYGIEIICINGYMFYENLKYIKDALNEVISFYKHDYDLECSIG